MYLQLFLPVTILLGIAIVSALQLRRPGIDGLHDSYWYVAGVMLLAALVMSTSYRRPTDDQLRAAGATS